MRCPLFFMRQRAKPLAIEFQRTVRTSEFSAPKTLHRFDDVIIVFH